MRTSLPLLGTAHAQKTIVQQTLRLPDRPSVIELVSSPSRTTPPPPGRTNGVPSGPVISASHSKKSSSRIGPAVNMGSAASPCAGDAEPGPADDDEAPAEVVESVVRSLYSFMSLRAGREGDGVSARRHGHARG